MGMTPPPAPDPANPMPVYDYFPDLPPLNSRPPHSAGLGQGAQLLAEPPFDLQTPIPCATKNQQPDRNGQLVNLPSPSFRVEGSDFARMFVHASDQITWPVSDFPLGLKIGFDRGAYLQKIA